MSSESYPVGRLDSSSGRRLCRVFGLNLFGRPSKPSIWPWHNAKEAVVSENSKYAEKNDEVKPTVSKKSEDTHVLCRRNTIVVGTKSVRLQSPPRIELGKSGTGRISIRWKFSGLAKYEFEASGLRRMNSVPASHKYSACLESQLLKRNSITLPDWQPTTISSCPVIGNKTSNKPRCPALKRNHHRSQSAPVDRYHPPELSRVRQSSLQTRNYLTRNHPLRQMYSREDLLDELHSSTSKSTAGETTGLEVDSDGLCIIPNERLHEPPNSSRPPKAGDSSNDITCKENQQDFGEILNSMFVDAPYEANSTQTASRDDIPQCRNPILLALEVRRPLLKRLRKLAACVNSRRKLLIDKLRSRGPFAKKLRSSDA